SGTSWSRWSRSACPESGFRSTIRSRCQSRTGWRWRLRWCFMELLRSGELPRELREMTDLMRRTLRRLAGETRGAEIAEAAAVLPLMFMMLLGIFWFGQAFSIYGAITRAAQDGARSGAAPTCST